MAQSGDRERTSITFLGTCANLPYAGEDCSSFVFNRRHLVDAGWYAAVRMLSFALNPMEIEHLFITHRHIDHIMGLPQLLHYRRIKRREGGEFPPLKILSPAADLEGVIERAIGTLHWPEDAVRPEALPLAPGDTWESEDLVARTCASSHTVDGETVYVD